MSLINFDPDYLQQDCDDPSVEAHRRIIEAGREDGIVCQCCGQFAKVYDRKLNSGQVRALIALYRTARREWAHVPDIPGVSRIGGEWARLRFYGLIEEYPHRREDGGRSGVWRVTELGERFVLGQAEVPAYSVIYNRELLRLEGESCSIRQALGKKFRYDELMGWDE